MELSIFHDFLVRSSDFSSAKSQVSKFLQDTTLIRYGSVEIDQNKSCSAENKVFWQKLDQGVAENIIKTGFEFSVAFDKTTTTVFNDPIDINYNHLVRKPFGKYIIVICISKNIYEKYSKLISKSGNNYLKVEEVLTESLIKKNDSDENVFTLHKNYIKGFFNYSTGEIRANKSFNSTYDSDQFKKNII